MSYRDLIRRRLAAVFVVFGISGALFAQTRTLRIVTYNIEDDTGGYTAPRPGLIIPSAGGTVQQGGVLEGIGEEVLAGVAQPLDILALQETTSNSVTVAPIVSGLNAFYNSAGMYAMSSYQAKTSGGITSGGGPNALVYNTTTLQLLASVPVDPPAGETLGSSSGEYREVVRYQFAPAGVIPTPANQFYVYVSHYKASTGSANEAYRAGEAAIIRNDEANNLPADARVLYVGDYNVTGGSSEAAYQTILASSAPNGIVQGQGFDPLNPSGATGIDWSTNTLQYTKTESATSLRYRDDMQLMTSNVFFGVPGGLAFVGGTYHTFGNNGTTAYSTSVNSGSNTSLTNLAAAAPISASALLLDLTTASDHLPVVADYTIPLGANPPLASFTGDPVSGTVPLTVTFTNTSASPITNWFWDFGDGTTTNVATGSVQHTYGSPGVFSVTEVVSGVGGLGTNIQPDYVTVLTGFQSWQIFYFGSTTNPAAAPDADADGTGQNNQFKYVAGLNPTNPASVFTWRITDVPNQPSWKNLIFDPMTPGRVYTLQMRTDLTANVWAPVTTYALPLATNGTQATITDTNAVFSAEFYRIGISLP